MDSSATSVRSELTPRSFDFLSDDECTQQFDPTINDKRTDPAAKDLNDNGVRYGQAEFSKEDVLSAVEKCMEKYADNLMMHLEGIDGRLTQLELYCQKLEQSIGDFRTDMIHDQGDGDLKLKFLEKHVHEVHRSVKIIRDKQELSETPKELAKLLLSPRESTNSTQPQKNSEGLNAISSENKPFNDRSDVSNQHLTLPFPHRISSSSPPSLATSAPDQIQHPYKDLPVHQPAPISLCMLPQDHYFLNQANTYIYDHHHPLPQHQQSPNLQPELHYVQQMPQMRDLFIQDESKRHPSGLQTLPTYASPAFIQHAVKCPESYQDSIFLPTLYSTPHNTQRQPLPQAIHGFFATPILTNSGYVGMGMSGHPVYFGGNEASHSPNGKLIAGGPNDHPLEDMIEKAVGMGYPRDQVLSAVRQIAESGQPLDLNLFLGRLKTLAGGGLHPVWEG